MHETAKHPNIGHDLDIPAPASTVVSAPQFVEVQQQDSPPDAATGSKAHARRQVHAHRQDDCMTQDFPAGLPRRTRSGFVQALWPGLC